MTPRARPLVLAAVLAAGGLALAAASTAPAGAGPQPTYCQKWSAQPDADIKRRAMRVNFLGMNKEEVDKACLYDALDQWVGWMDQLCADPARDHEAVTAFLKDAAREACPAR